MKVRDNPILDTDSYKPSHAWQFPDGLEDIMSYLSSRGGLFGKTMSLGYQYQGLRYLTDPVTMEDVDEASELLTPHGVPFDRESWIKVVEKGGTLPIRIRVVPEGTMVPTGNALMKVECLDRDFAKISGCLETSFVRLWYPQTVATLSHYIKRDILAALITSSNDPMGEVEFKLQDFGSRGVSSKESAGIGGMAHLVNFKGSDTIEGIRYAKTFYGEPMAGYSIAASEHSTITSWGKDGELAAYRNMIKQFLKPGKYVACVSDSYDIYNAVQNLWGEELREEVKNSGGTLVIRPDSGTPVEVVLKCLRILEDKVGMTKNLKGYKQLPPYFRLIQGDGINRDSIREILEEMLRHNYSASNITFGMGGGLLQQVNRDTQKYAYKCCQVTVNGEHRKVFKDPVTDPGKRSLSGDLDLIVENGQFKTVEGRRHNSALVTVYENGKILNLTTFSDVRKRADSDLL